MTIEDTRAFLERISKTGSILGMESITQLCKELGNPEDYGKIIHIAGTNGKGSTGAMIEQTLIGLGYKVGRYTSPAVFCYEEIFSINKTPIKQAYLAKIMTQVKMACESMVQKGMPHPTLFEVETAAAFLYFAQEHCDFTLIEVGMGGRSDATNVIKKPIVSVITSISKDHMQFLGNSIEEIAAMKAGIIKNHCSIVKLYQTDEINQVFGEEAEKTQGGKQRLVWAKAKNYPIIDMDHQSMIIEDRDLGEVKLSMSGEFQQENFACAMETLRVLEKKGYIHLKENRRRIKESLSSLTWPGRFETVMEQPLCIIDGCHNIDAAQKLRDTITRVASERRIHFVIGVLQDKDYRSIFSEVLPCGVSAACITPNNKRGLAKECAAEIAREFLTDVATYESVPMAMNSAFNKCKTKQDMVLVFGSLSYLGEVKRYVDEIC